MKIKNILVIFIAFSLSCTLSAQTDNYPLTSVDGLELVNLKVEPTSYKGKEAIRLTNDMTSNPKLDKETLVILSETNFRNGTIEVELAGLPATGSFEGARGFIGIAFRVNPDDHSEYDCFYLRPTNGRAEDQLRRNHTTQYISHPDFPWHKLRQETPGMYESYADLVPGDWTKVKIEVKETKASLYLHGSDQPCLIVNDLKRGSTEGKIALWIHATTEGYYRNLNITVK